MRIHEDSNVLARCSDCRAVQANTKSGRAGFDFHMLDIVGSWRDATLPRPREADLSPLPKMGQPGAWLAVGRGAKKVRDEVIQSHTSVLWLRSEAEASFACDQASLASAVTIVWEECSHLSPRSFREKP